MKNGLKRFVSGVLASAVMVSCFSFGTASTVFAADPMTVYTCDGVQEAAYIEWAAVPSTDHYYVDYSANGTDFTQIDDSLIRQYSDRWRADIVGLKAGDYTIRIRCNDKSNNEIASVTKTVTVVAHERIGFTFDTSSSMSHKDDPLQCGAYNGDGTLKSNANIIYITSADDINTVTYEGFTGLSTILENRSKESANPLCVRIIGKIDYSGEQLNSAGYIQVKPAKAYTDINTTIEGIGSDASINFGFLCRNAGNVEIRNLAVHDFKDDGFSLDTSNQNIWIHNNDFFYGKQGSGDKAKGDGSTDIKNDSKYITISYNRYWDCGKVSLCGMKSESGENFITYHHNWFDHSDSRMPRIRTMSVHVFNNYYDGCAKYGVGASKQSNAFVECNYFRNTKYPTLQGSVGHDSDGKGSSNTFDDAPPIGAIKVWNNYMTGSLTQFTPGSNGETESNADACVATSRDQVLDYTTKAGATYNNFDTKSSYIQSLTPDEPSVAKDKTVKYAGRIGQDFNFAFTDADDSDYEINTNLRSAITTYMSNKTLVSVGGASDGSGPVEITTETTTAAETTTETTTENLTETTTEAVPVPLGTPSASSTPSDATPDGVNEVIYQPATDDYLIHDTSATTATVWEIPFATQTSGTVIISGRVSSTKAAGKWAFVQVRGKNSDGKAGEQIALASNDSKNIAMRVGGSTYISLGDAMAANTVYNYVFAIDLDNNKATLIVNGKSVETNINISEVSSVYMITANTAIDRDLTATLPYVANTEGAESTVRWGDANNNGDIDADDAAKILQYTLNPAAISFEPAVLAKLDVNADNSIDAADASCVLQKALVSTFPLKAEEE